jgi:hypothetical protein
MRELAILSSIYLTLPLYLVWRGVPARQVGRILLASVVGGVAASLAMGSAAWLAITPLIFAPIMAAAHIHGSLTAVGIVVLNVAVNLAPPGKVPASLACVAAFIPIPEGPLRVTVDLAVLHLPALAALGLLAKGPPGGVRIRLLLGAWLCLVGVASLLGPIWQLLASEADSGPVLWAGFAILGVLGVEVVMLVVSYLFALTGSEPNIQALVRSVRFGRESVALALATAAGFALLARQLLNLPLSDQTKSSVVLGAGWIVAVGFAMRRDDLAADQPLPSALPFARGLLLAMAIGAYACVVISANMNVGERVDR